ncbi:MAG: pseudouridine synthase [Thiotrichales bacterium]
MSDGLQILHRDDHLVVIYKPAGLLVHRSAIDRGATEFALQMVRDQLGRRVFPVHRLDRPVAGVLLFALDADVARTLGAAFAAGLLGKSYLALVRGHTPDRADIDYPLREQLDRMTDALADPDKPAQAAITGYRTVARFELPHAVGRYASARYALLEVLPRTGRKHQIRRHLKHVFHPIIGDTTHGDGKHNRFFREHFGCARLLLVATRIGFTHPVTGAALAIAAAPDAEFAAVLDGLRRYPA